MPSLIVINWIVGVIGSIGIIGVILLAVFAPAAAAVLWRVVIDFVSTRLGLAIVVGAACLYGGLVYGDVSGRREEAAKCQAAQDTADAESKARDAEQGQLAGADAAARLTQLEDQSAKDKETIDAYAKDLAARKSPGCALGPDDLR